VCELLRDASSPGLNRSTLKMEKRKGAVRSMIYASASWKMLVCGESGEMVLELGHSLLTH